MKEAQAPERRTEALMDVRDLIAHLRPGRDRLIENLAGCLTISQARWDGDPQTVVHIDRLIPMLAIPIILTPDELQAFGLRKGPSTTHGGYADRAYYELAT
jgi:hypothetical protein